MKHIILRTLIITTSCTMFTPYIYNMEEIKHALEHITHHSHHHSDPTSPVLAQHNPGMSNGEKAYLQKRLPIVKAALEKLLGCTLEEKQVPNISLVCSGGGYRAMLCTTGSLCAAKKMGLLDATTHITALSGSTWAVAPWIATGKSPQEFKEYVKKCAAKSFTDFTLKEEALVAKAIISRINRAPWTFVDPYGFCLANRLLKDLKDKRHTITLSELRAKIESGAYPYTIFTATDARDIKESDETWYDFTVDTLRDHTNNIHIPIDAYGHTFKEGILQHHEHEHEKSLGYNMGTWGSAFGANVLEILHQIVKDPVLRKEIESKLPKSIESTRPLRFYAEVPNYMFEMKMLEDATMSSEQHLVLVDSGLEINLPYPPVSGKCAERTPEILILLDASAGHIGTQLKHMRDYAKKYNLPFPIGDDADLSDVGTKTMTVFKDEHNPKAPVLIYLPRISDPVLWEEHRLDPEFKDYNLHNFNLDHETNHGFAETQHFQYSPEHSTLVTNQTEFNMLVNRDKIIETIKWVIERKK